MSERYSPASWAASYSWTRWRTWTRATRLPRSEAAAKAGRDQGPSAAGRSVLEPRSKDQQ
jgi:hypothetical protein